MDAVLLALCSAALFGSMTVLLPRGLRTGVAHEAASLLAVTTGFAVALAVAVAQGFDSLDGIGPFLLAGLLGPGLSQLLFTLAVREAGASRASVAAGTAPLFAVALALVFLDEPVVAGLLAGAVLVVAGGVVLVTERNRPAALRPIGIALAGASALVFATRDTLVRWLSTDTSVEPALAAAATLASGALAILVVVAVGRRRPTLAAARGFAPAGICFGLSYVLLFEAYYRGPVSVVSPLVATESLWAVALAALFLGRHEAVGRRLVLGASLVVAGGALIGVFR